MVLVCYTLKMVKKLSWIIGVLVFVVVAGFIAIEITKMVVRGIMKAKMENSILADKTTQAEFDQIVDDNVKIIINGIFRQPKVENPHEVTWAGHVFEVEQLRTSQYKSDGTVEFTNDGFRAGSYSMPRTKLLDVNLNQKIKVKIKADFEGRLDSSAANSNENCVGFCITTERYHFSEFGIYLLDESTGKMGMRVLGTRHNTVRGNSRKEFKFTELTVENTGDEVILTDSSGNKLIYSKDFAYVTGEAGKGPNTGTGNYGKLSPNEKWVLGINSHINGEGYSKLKIKEIQVIKFNKQ